MTACEEALQRAIAAIEAFLARTSSGPLSVTAGDFEDLSARIEQSRCIRQLYATSVLPNNLHQAYRDRLLLLQRRLREIETGLATERQRVTEDQARVTRVREWHALLTTIQ